MAETEHASWKKTMVREIEGLHAIEDLTEASIRSDLIAEGRALERAEVRVKHSQEETPEALLQCAIQERDEWYEEFIQALRGEVEYGEPSEVDANNRMIGNVRLAMDQRDREQQAIGIESAAEDVPAERAPGHSRHSISQWLHTLAEKLRKNEGREVTPSDELDPKMELDKCDHDQQAIGIEMAAQLLTSLGAEDGDINNLLALAETVRSKGAASEIPNAYERGRNAEQGAILELLWEKTERAKNDNPHGAHMCMVLREEILQGLHADG